MAYYNTYYRVPKGSTQIASSAWLGNLGNLGKHVYAKGSLRSYSQCHISWENIPQLASFNYVTKHDMCMPVLNKSHITSVQLTVCVCVAYMPHVCVCVHACVPATVCVMCHLWMSWSPHPAREWLHVLYYTRLWGVAADTPIWNKRGMASHPIHSLDQNL